MSSLLCPLFFADKHFHIGTLDKRRFELHSYGAVENSRGGDGEEFASQAKKRNGRMSRHRRRARLLRSHLVRFFGALTLVWFDFSKYSQFATVLQQRVYWTSCVTATASAPYCISCLICLSERFRESREQYTQTF